MKYECVNGPFDGGTEEAFANLAVGHVVNIRAHVSLGSSRVHGHEQYVYWEDGKLHYRGFNPDGPIDTEALDRLMGGAKDELIVYLRESVIPRLRHLPKGQWGDPNWDHIADHLEQLVSEQV